MEIKDIEGLAALARIELSKPEKESLLKNIERILAFVGQIAEVGTKDLPEERVGMLRNVMREDGEPHETGIHTEELLAGAPVIEKGYVKVKRIL